jgi:hypothetical protein
LVKNKVMDIQESKIALVKTILNIDNIEIIEKITDFINDEFGNDLTSNISSDHNEETEKGIETIIRMVGEFK